MSKWRCGCARAALWKTRVEGTVKNAFGWRCGYAWAALWVCVGGAAGASFKFQVSLLALQVRVGGIVLVTRGGNLFYLMPFSSV